MAILTADLAVIGGGVIGLTLAWRAALEGFQVTLIEKGRLGSESSWAGAGMLPAGANRDPRGLDPLEALRSLSHPLHVQWAAELRETTSIDNGFRACGGLYVARTQGEFASLLAQQSWWDAMAIQYERLQDADLAERYPQVMGLAGHPMRAWYVPDDAQLRNPHHLRALRAACERLGVAIHEDSPCLGWSLNAGRVKAVRTHLGELSAATYCLTSGAWSGMLAEELGCGLDIYPVRGQIVLFHLQTPTQPFIVNDGHRYLVFRSDGRVLAGSCEEEVGFRNETTSVMLEELQHWAIGLMPRLSRASVEKSWAGLRPATVDGFPYMGKVPNIENAFVAAGHFRHGLHWSTATADLMLDLIQQRTTAIDMTPFSLQRGKVPKVRLAMDE